MSGHPDQAQLDTVPTVVDVIEDVDLVSLPRFRALLQEAVSAGLDVIVDLTRCESIHGGCVRELLLAQARLGQQELRLVIISDPDTVTFFVLRLIHRQALTLYPTLELGQIALQLR